MFPSTLSTFNQTHPTDRLNSPSHSALHNTVSSAVGQIEAVIGVDGANSVLGTVIGDLRSPDSGGGGHVQTANKGGTGQTSYNKGDLLVATSSSVLAKFAVGSVSGQLLTADTTQASGMKWTNAFFNKIATSYMGVSKSVGAGSVATALYQATIPGSTLGTSNVIRFMGTVPTFGINNAGFTTDIQYGNQSILSLTVSTPNIYTNLNGTIEGGLVGIGTSSVYAYMKTFIGTTSSMYGMTEGSVAAAVDSSSNKTLFINGKFSNASNQNSILSGIFIVEKIA